MSTSVKVFDSGQAGAPVLSGTAGALRAVLKACLVDGFGAGAAASVTVAAGVATAIYSSGHSFRVGSVALFAGATGTGINGERRVLTTAADRVTFAAPDAAAGTAAGSITSRMAPAGWQELFAGQLANVIALAPTVAEATGCVLRVDDTGTVSARVVGYEAMSDISTGVGAFPMPAQANDGIYWPKSMSANSTAVAWRLFADERAFHLWVGPRYPTLGFIGSFGDLQSLRSGDAWACLISAGDSNVHYSGNNQHGCMAYGSAANASANTFLARAHTGLGGSQLVRKVAPYNLGGGYSGTQAYNANAWPYPNGADNSLRLSAVEIAQAFGGLRGRVAGLYHTPQMTGEAFGTGDRIDGQGEFAGRTFIALRAGPTGGGLDGAGTAFVDVTGPWRP